MKLSKMLEGAVVAALALMAFASSASASTLYVNGVAQTGQVTIHATFEEGTSALLSDTFGFFANTCTESTMEGETTTFTGTPSGPITTLTFGKCTENPVVVDTTGSLSVERIGTTNNGTLRSLSARITAPSPFGALTCITAASPGTDIGTLTGSTTGRATIDFTVVLNCGSFLPSAKWTGSYTVTSPERLTVGA